MVDESKRKGLGRGLSALLSDVREMAPDNTDKTARPGRDLPIEQLVPNPGQPRKRFAPEALEDLVASIRSRGILQPILVRQRDPSRYEIVAGERRWRAAQAAGLHKVPVIVRAFTDAEVMEVALVENIQRTDLSPMEEAAGYQRLIDDFGHTQEAIATLVGKSRSHVANCLRLLALPEPVRRLVDEGALSAGHGRALVGLRNAAALAQRAVAEGLNVRQMEVLAKAAKETVGPPAKAAAVKDPDTAILEGELSAALGLGVTIAHKGEAGGALTIRYRTLDELDGLCARLSRVEE